MEKLEPIEISNETYLKLCENRKIIYKNLKRRKETDEEVLRRLFKTYILYSIEWP